MTATIRRIEKGYRLEASQRLPRPVEEVFPFFADAFNLEAITPGMLHFRVLTPAPIVMTAGTLIDYRLRIGGVPTRWRSEISAWEPPFRFVDEQRRGPYRWWIHEHRFHEEQGETVVVDRVDYGVPGGALPHRLFVAPALRRIFAHRRESLHRAFCPDACVPDVVGPA